MFKHTTFVCFKVRRTDSQANKSTYQAFPYNNNRRNVQTKKKCGIKKNFGRTNSGAREPCADNKGNQTKRRADGEAPESVQQHARSSKNRHQHRRIDCVWQRRVSVVSPKRRVHMRAHRADCACNRRARRAWIALGGRSPTTLVTRHSFLFVRPSFLVLSALVQQPKRHSPKVSNRAAR